MNKMHYCLSVLLAGMLLISVDLSAQELQAIRLNPPDTTRGLPFMRALAVKASATEWSDRDLSLQDLSDLMWAANGLNRPGENKTTASSAMNAHDVDIYVFMKNGVFVYDYTNHQLAPVVRGDFRSDIIVRRASAAPTDPQGARAEAAIEIVLISDADRFRSGTDETRYEYGAIDTGIISQNISLFCAATGLKTRPRASMNKERIREILRLKDTQHMFLNHPVGYAR
jgi:SagB-type dehydrogenase family enzyme